MKESFGKIKEIKPILAPRKRFKYRIGFFPSSSHTKLMKIVKDERDKHKEMMNLISNTTYSLSRRPVRSSKKSSKFSYQNLIKIQNPEFFAHEAVIRQEKRQKDQTLTLQGKDILIGIFKIFHGLKMLKNHFRPRKK